MYVYSQRRFTPRRSCEFAARASASLSGARTRAPFARVHANLCLCPARTDGALPSSSFDSRPAVDDASSRTSRSESFLFLVLPSLRRLLPSCPPLSPPPPPHPFPTPLSSCSLSFFALAVLTNAGYNSIVGHDPQAVLTPRERMYRAAD